MRTFLIGSLLSLASACSLSAQAPAALSVDPPQNRQHPAHNSEMRVLSHGVNLLGVYYYAAGEGPHPTAILFHGFPGYEQNLDIAQSMRRAGWNVMALHYRGSWGVPGDYSFTHVLEDADAQVAFLLDPANTAKYQVDTKKLVLVGHSMGGYLAASAAAHEPRVFGSVMISAWNIPSQFAKVPANDEAAAIANFEKSNPPERLLPLHTTAKALAVELYGHMADWQMVRFADAIGKRPLLIVTSNDNLAPGSEALRDGLKAKGNNRVTYMHLETDHGYNDQRITLQTAILKWVGEL